MTPAAVSYCNAAARASGPSPLTDGRHSMKGHAMSDDDLDREVALAWAAVVAFFAGVLGLSWVLAGWLV